MVITTTFFTNPIFYYWELDTIIMKSKFHFENFLIWLFSGLIAEQRGGRARESERENKQNYFWKKRYFSFCLQQKVRHVVVQLTLSKAHCSNVYDISRFSIYLKKAQTEKTYKKNTKKKMKIHK